MKKDSTHYNKVSSIALIVFLALVIIQIFWLKKAVQLDTQERVLKLQQLIPDLALEVNALDPSAFHGEEVKTGIKSLNLDTVKL
ncbi:hypothetical protein N9B82_05825, partial [Saprospiraceae bacterium]|nr:hypothetical protein [Saprospiraceae bacterium]